MIFYVEQAGKYGVVEDAPDYQLPKEAWTSVRNMRPINGVMTSLQTDKAVTSPTTTDTLTFLYAIRTASEIYWFVAGQSDAFLLDSSTASTIRTNLTGAISNKWTGGLGSVPIFNNGVDDPFAVTYDPTVGYTALTGWPASYKAKMVRPFREFWIAGDVTDTGSRYNQLIHWSSPAAPGAMPPDWDYSDSTKKSGRQDLADEGGSVVDGLTVGRVFFVYKEETTWTLSLKGGVSVMQIDPFMNNVGLHGPNHAQILPDNNVFLVGPMGVIRHDMRGNQTPLLKRRLQRWLDATVDATNYKNGYVTRMPAKKEIHYCFPSNGSTLCDTALVWSYEDDYLFIKDLPDVSAGGSGPWDESGSVPLINALTGTINSYTNVIDRQVPVGLQSHGVYAATDDVYTHETEGGGFSYAPGELIRTGLLMDTAPEEDVYIKSVTPYISGQPSTDIQITVGWQDEIEGRVNWELTRTYDPDTDVKADFRVEGKIPCIRFQGSGDWSLFGYAVDYEVQGRRQRNG